MGVGYTGIHFTSQDGIPRDTLITHAPVGVIAMANTTDAHEHPISVEKTHGPTYAVKVTETFNDGSESTEFYTEEQAETLLVELTQALHE